MAVDEKISQLDTGIPTAGDFVPFVDDPGGTPVTKKFLWDQGIEDISALTPATGTFIVGDGANWVAKNGATARTSMGLGTGDSPTFEGLTLSASAGTDNTLQINGASDRYAFNVTGFTISGASVPQVMRAVATLDPAGNLSAAYGLNNNVQVGGSGSFNITNLYSNFSRLTKVATYSGTITNSHGIFVANATGSPTITNQIGLKVALLSAGTNNYGVIVQGNNPSGFGRNVPTAMIDVDQSDTVGAMPVAKFDQADLDQPFFEFATTIGVGNAIEAVGAKTLTVTHFLMVEIPGGLIRYQALGTIA